MVVAALSGGNNILGTIILSIIVTAVLWLIQSIFHLNVAWTFIVFIGLLFALYYLVLPALNRRNITI